MMTASRLEALKTRLDFFIYWSKIFLKEGNMNTQNKETLKDYLLMIPAAIVMAVGVYFFRFPNNFTAGGVTGLGVIFGKLSPTLSATVFTNILNIVLLIIGMIMLGKDFGLKTLVFTVLFTAIMTVFDKCFPMTKPFTDEPFLELFLAILLPSIGSAMLFKMGASGGGTDIVALIAKKYTHIYNTGNAILAADFLISAAAFFVFDVKTGIFSIVGLLLRMLMIDAILKVLNQKKYFHIVTDNPEPIVEFITKKLNRSATIFEGVGAYSKVKKTLILTAVNQKQAIDLKIFVRTLGPGSFVLINSTSEVYAKGFRCNI